MCRVSIRSFTLPEFVDMTSWSIWKTWIKLANSDKLRFLTRQMWFCNFFCLHVRLWMTYLRVLILSPVKMGSFHSVCRHGKVKYLGNAKSARELTPIKNIFASFYFCKLRFPIGQMWFFRTFINDLFGRSFPDLFR